MRCTVVTHIDVGPGPLRDRRPRQTGPVTIGAGAYLGAGATVLVLLLPFLIFCFAIAVATIAALV